MLIDSHCHLNYEPLISSIPDVIKDCKKNNIQKILSIGTTFKNSEISVNLTNKYKELYTTVGIHPHEADNDKDNFKYLIKLFDNPNKIIGVGETGLDYYYENSKKNTQIELFQKHIELAKLKKIPVIVHTRSADIDTINMINMNIKNSNVKFLIHCFSGGLEFCKKLLDLDCHISFSGIITFKNSQELRETAKIVPLNKILVETDSPYLSPVPLRGQSNTPSNVKFVADCLAKIKGISLEEISEITTRNFNNLFDIKESDNEFKKTT